MAGPHELSGSAPTEMARVSKDSRETRADRLAVEAPIAFVYNHTSHAVMMASPRDLEDFAHGFTLAEGVVADASEILSVKITPKGPGMSLAIKIPETRALALGARKRNVAGRTGCGLCGIADIEQVLRPLPVLADSRPISSEAVLRALAALPGEQSLNAENGAVHAAAFAAPDGALVIVREDVGRHNALDKLIGAAARQGLDASSGFIVVTSRCSMEMVQKTATFGCPILVAVSAPTSLAVELAGQSNLTVSAFARDSRFNLYVHPERIV